MLESEVGIVECVLEILEVVYWYVGVVCVVVFVGVYCVGIDVLVDLGGQWCVLLLVVGYFGYW